jgi:hypothetical protein
VVQHRHSDRQPPPFTSNSEAGTLEDDVQNPSTAFTPATSVLGQAFIYHHAAPLTNSMKSSVILGIASLLFDSFQVDIVYQMIYSAIQVFPLRLD